MAEDRAKVSGPELAKAILARLEKVRGPNAEGNYEALCPFHPDKKRSFSFHPAKGYKCFACPAQGNVEALARHLGIEIEVGLTLEALSEAKELPVDFLAGWGWRTLKGRLPAVAIPWHGLEGPSNKPPALHIRHRIGKEGNGPRWTWKGKAQCPYGAWRLSEWRAQAKERGIAPYVVICESEADCLTLWLAGFPAIATGGADFWKPAWAKLLMDFQSILIFQEPGQGGREMAKRVAASLRDAGYQGEVIAVPFPAETKDANALYQAQGRDKEAFQKALRDMVEKARSQAPAPSAPVLGDTLDRVAAFLKRFVAFSSEHQVVATALWTAHTYAIGAADTTPYLSVTSPEKRSGKTRLLEVLELLTKRPWRTILPSEAVLFRKIARDMPTLLLDEVDTIFKKPPPPAYEPLRAVLNAGYRRGQSVPRCIGKGADLELTDFEIFCPKALAGIGGLPSTIADRSIPIRLARRAPGQKVERFRFRDAEIEAQSIREGLETLAKAVAELRAARPPIPPELNDRAAEGWEPLLAIADLAGADWPGKARKACVVLHCEGEQEDSSDGVQLLAAIREVFNGRDRITTGELLKALIEREGPWADWWEEKLAKGNLRGPGSRLARLLAPFGVRPRNLRDPDGVAKGYLVGDFLDAFMRYLPPLGEKGRYNATSEAGDVSGGETKKDATKAEMLPLSREAVSEKNEANVALLPLLPGKDEKEDFVEV